ncbi:MAG: PKD domain-containing protein [Cyclobacteriaceae bacterium]
MKTVKKISFRLLMLLSLASVTIMTSCDEDEPEVIPATPPVASFTASASSVELGTAITFTNTSTDATAAQWSFGDGETSTDMSPSHTYALVGNYTVTLIASGEGGTNQTTAEVTITEPAPTEEPIEVYFTDNTGDVFTVQKISGIGVEIKVETAFSTTGYAINMIYDDVNGKVYYSDDDNGQIVSVNLDGTSQEIVATGLAEPRGLALNDDQTLLYFNERGIDQVSVIDLSTSVITILYTIEDFGIAPEDGLIPEALAYHNGDLYITAVEIDAESVWTAKADGSSETVTNIIDYNTGGYGYSIVVDPTNNKLFFDDTDSNKIMTSDLDGANISSVANTGDKAYGLALDLDAGKIYYGDNAGSIKRANLDGSEEEDLSTVQDRVNRGLFIVKK